MLRHESHSVDKLNLFDDSQTLSTDLGLYHRSSVNLGYCADHFDLENFDWKQSMKRSEEKQDGFQEDTIQKEIQ